MCAGEKAAAAVMPIVQSSVWRGAILILRLVVLVVVVLFVQLHRMNNASFMT